MSDDLFILVRADGSVSEQVFVPTGSSPSELGQLPDGLTEYPIDRFGEPWEDFVPGTGWVANMTLLRAIKWEAVKAKRTEVQTGGCNTPSGRAQTDLESLGLINGAVTMAILSLQASAPYSIEFTLADNTSIALDAAGMIALGQAVGIFIAVSHARSVALRAAIDAAADPAALDAIDIESGWPT